MYRIGNTRSIVTFKIYLALILQPNYSIYLQLQRNNNRIFNRLENLWFPHNAITNHRIKVALLLILLILFAV